MDSRSLAPTTPCSIPKTMVLSITPGLIQMLKDKPCTFVMRFSPTLPGVDEKYKDSWQITVKILATAKERLAKKNEYAFQSNEPALLLAEGQACYGQFPKDLDLTPRNLSLHRDVNNSGSLIRVSTKENHYRIVAGKTYHFHINFPDLYLFYQLQKRGWRVTGSVYRQDLDIKDASRDISFISRIQLNWLATIEKDLSPPEAHHKHIVAIAPMDVDLQNEKNWTPRHFDLQWLKEPVPMINDIKSYTPNDINLECKLTYMATDYTAPGFSPSSINLLCQVEVLDRRVRQLKLEEKHPLCPVSNRWSQFFSTAGKLFAWESLETYLKVESQDCTVASLQKQAVALQLHALTRLNWVLQIENNATPRVSSDMKLDHMLSSLARDLQWMKETENFLKLAEAKNNFLIHSQPKLSSHFFKEHANGPWPHDVALKKQIENAGFVFRPMPLIYDRFSCNDCGVEVSAFRPWHNPWRMHNWSMPHLIAPPDDMYLLGP